VFMRKCVVYPGSSCGHIGQQRATTHTGEMF
jgi:hypothetical protein